MKVGKEISPINAMMTLVLLFIGATMLVAAMLASFSYAWEKGRQLAEGVSYDCPIQEPLDAHKLSGETLHF